MVIPVWHGLPHLPECLAALRAQSFRDFETIAVDNASPDGAGEWLAGQPDVRLVRNPRNLGFAGGTNAGIRASSGACVVTLNQDTVPHPRFLEELVAAARGPRVGMVASKMLVYHDAARINSAGLALLPELYGIDRGIEERDAGPWEAAGEVFGPCAGAALYARAMLDEVGLFDEEFFAYFEDLDLAWRARLAGWRCVYNPRAVVLHKHRSSAQRRSGLDVPREVVAWCERNRVWVIAKNAGLSTLLLRAPALVAHEAWVLAEALRDRDATKLRARAEALAGLRGMLAKRRRVRALRRVPEAAVRAWIPPLPTRPR